MCVCVSQNAGGPGGRPLEPPWSPSGRQPSRLVLTERVKGGDAAARVEWRLRATALDASAVHQMVKRRPKPERNAPLDPSGSHVPGSAKRRARCPPIRQWHHGRCPACPAFEGHAHTGPAVWPGGHSGGHSRSCQDGSRVGRARCPPSADLAMDGLGERSRQGHPAGKHELLPIAAQLAKQPRERGLPA